MKGTVVILILFSFLGISCKKPKACIEADMLTAKRKQKITLMGTCSTKANNFAWDFGNGTKGQGDTVQVSYLFKGTYDVQLIVYSRSGKSNGIIQKIVIQ